MDFHSVKETLKVLLFPFSAFNSIRNILRFKFIVLLFQAKIEVICFALFIINYQFHTYNPYKL